MSDPDLPDGGRRSWGASAIGCRGARAIVFIALLLCGTAWSLAAPYDGPPDEREHVLRAAGVADGQVFAPLTTAGLGAGAMQTVPASLWTVGCFQLKPTQSAACQREPGGDATPQRVVSRAGRYNPAYYFVVGWPLRLWPNWLGIVLARMITAAWVAALLTAALDSAARFSNRGAMVAGVVVAATPMLVHLAGAVNPAGVEIAAGICLFASAIPLLDGQGRLEPALIRRVGYSAVILATLRSLGPLWLALALGVLLVPSSRALLRALWRSRQVRVWGLVSFAAVAAGVAWTVGMHATTLIAAGVDVTFGQAVKHEVVSRWPSYAQQMVCRLSYDDTVLPSLSYILWYGALGALVYLAFGLSRWVDRWRLFAIIAATFAVPTLSDAATVHRFGYGSQGRYMLPLAVGLPLLAAYLIGRGAPARPADPKEPAVVGTSGGVSVGPLIRVLAATLLPLQLLALYVTMLRWQRGLPADSAHMPLNPLRGAWLPVLGPALPLLTMMVGITMLLLLAWRVSRFKSVDGAECAHAAGDRNEPALASP